MRTTNKSKALLITVVFALSLFGCGGSGEGVTVEDSASTTSSTIASKEFPLTGDPKEDFNRAMDIFNRGDAVTLCSLIRGWGQLGVSSEDINVVSKLVDKLATESKSTVFDELIGLSRAVLESAEVSPAEQVLTTSQILADSSCTSIGISSNEAWPTASDGSPIAQSAS